MIGMLIAGNEAKRRRAECGQLDLAYGVTPRGITVDQQREHHRREIGQDPESA